MGDMHVAGKPLIGAYTAFKGGHALNNKLLRALLADASAFEVVSFDKPPKRRAGWPNWRRPGRPQPGPAP